MKIIIAILTLMAIHATLAESPQVLLSTKETTIKANTTVQCDVYLYNDSDAAIVAPSFATIATILSLHDVKGERLPRSDSSSLVTGHASAKQRLEPRAAKRTTITIKIPAEPGDLVELYVEIGSDPIARSNRILLFCPLQEKGTGK